MTTELTFHLINSITYVLGFGALLWILISTMKQIRTSNKHNSMIEKQLVNMQQLITANHQEEVIKMVMMHEALKDIQANLKIVESKIGDLTMRVNIAEVRLEERKPQQLMMPVPPVQQISMAPKRGGRRTKTTTPA
jgi:hypothetical protein